MTKKYKTYSTIALLVLAIAFLAVDIISDSSSRINENNLKTNQNNLEANRNNLEANQNNLKEPSMVKTVNCGDTITSTTTLTADLYCNPDQGDAALYIEDNSDDEILLNCENFKIVNTGNKVASTTGIQILGTVTDPASNIKIQNCHFVNFSNAIYVPAANDAVYQNNIIESAVIGIIHGGANALIEQNNIEAQMFGIYLKDYSHPSNNGSYNYLTGTLSADNAVIRHNKIEYKYYGNQFWINIPGPGANAFSVVAGHGIRFDSINTHFLQNSVCGFENLGPTSFQDTNPEIAPNSMSSSDIQNGLENSLYNAAFNTCDETESFNDNDAIGCAFTCT